jgi:hypothetical protein
MNRRDAENAKMFKGKREKSITIMRPIAAKSKKRPDGLGVTMLYFGAQVAWLLGILNRVDHRS